MAVIRTGLIGAGIQYSSSPALHETEGRHLGLDYRYSLFDLDGEPYDGTLLTTILEDMQRRSFAGCNVTYPVKQTVLPLLDELTPEAAAIGAVNTIRFTDGGQRIGHNTDWWGFAENLKVGLKDRSPGRAILLGAGGAGAAAAYGLARAGASQLVVMDRDEARAEELARRVADAGLAARAMTLDRLPQAFADADGLVQATPVGMAKLPGLPFDPELLSAHHWLAEIIYVPVETELVAAARRTGCTVITGVGMVVLQAARAFEIFTDITPDAARMMNSFRAMPPS